MGLFFFFESASCWCHWGRIQLCTKTPTCRCVNASASLAVELRAIRLITKSTYRLGLSCLNQRYLVSFWVLWDVYAARSPVATWWVAGILLNLWHNCQPCEGILDALGFLEYGTWVYLVELAPYARWCSEAGEWNCSGVLIQISVSCPIPSSSLLPSLCSEKYLLLLIWLDIQLCQTSVCTSHCREHTGPACACFACRCGCSWPSKS